MTKFADAIQKVNSDLLEFIKKYEIIDDKEPIDNNLLKKLKKQINSLNTSAYNNDLDLSTKFDAFNKSFNLIVSNSNKQITAINKNLNTALLGLEEKYKNKITDLKNEIINMKNESNESIKLLYQDIDYFIAASKQREATLILEYEENVKRYNYQIENAKENYNTNILQFNTSFANDDKQIKIDYDEALNNYDESTKKLIDRLSEKIDAEIKNLAEINKNLNAIRLQMKEKFHQESVTLNGEIKTLVEQKNKEIVSARDTYTKALANSATDRNNKKNDYQTESQKILKDYVYNLTELDDYSTECKNIYLKDIKKEKMSFYCDSLGILKNENYEVKTIIDENKKYSDSEKYTKRLIRQRHKYYYAQYNSKKISKLKKMTDIEIMYQSEFERTRNSKALLELEKNHSLKILSEKEQSDNKYYQELDSIYENDMNLLIKIANMKFNQNANLVKCKSRIRSKSIERDLDFNEANLQKDIEKIQNSIDKYQFEIDGTTSLQQIIHKYELDRYNLRHNHLTVENLLEIEKCKVLQNYNERQYNFNILTSKANLDYSKAKLALENDKFKKLTELNAQINKSMLHKDLVGISYKIKENQLYLDEDKQIQNRNSQYQIDSINHDILFNRFKNEIKIINQALSTYIIFIRDLERFVHKFLLTFFSDIQVRPEYLQIIKVFITTFQNIVKEYFKNISTSFNDTISDIVSKRVDFEEKFKFKSYYNDLLEQYESDQKRLLNKNSSLNDTIENYTNTIEIFKSRIYNFKNQNSLIRQKMFGNTKEAKKELLAKFVLNKQKSREFATKIEEINKLKLSVVKERESITNALKNTEKDYNRRVSEIKLMQYNSAISFYNLKDNIQSIIKDIVASVYDKSGIIQVKYFRIDRYLDQMTAKYNSANTTAFKKIYDTVNEFTYETKESITRDKKLLFLKFRNDLDHIYNHFSSLENENNNEYNKNSNIYNEQIEELASTYKNEENRFESKIAQNDKDYQKAINNILEEKGNSLTQFYKEFYGMCDNLDTVNELYEKNMNYNDNNFQLEKNTLTKNIIKNKTEANQKLANFNRSKEELINHLPQAEKFFATQVNKETKDLNTEIENEIKELKIQALNSKREIQKNITSIENTLEQTIAKNEQIHQNDVTKEKRIHQSNLRKIEKIRYAEDL